VSIYNQRTPSKGCTGGHRRDARKRRLIDRASGPEAAKPRREAGQQRWCRFRANEIPRRDHGLIGDTDQDEAKCSALIDERVAACSR
jgi:hypothetical protein